MTIRISRRGRRRRTFATSQTSLTLDADQRSDARYASSETGMLGRGYDDTDVLIGAGRFFGDAPRRGALDQDSLRGEVVDDLAAAPLPERSMAGKGAARAMARRREGLLFGRRLADENV